VEYLLIDFDVPFKAFIHEGHFSFFKEGQDTTTSSLSLIMPIYRPSYAVSTDAVYVAIGSHNNEVGAIA
jgi:hypothetical protein